MPLDSFYIKLNKFKRDISDLKGVSPRKKEKKELKNKVLPNVKKHYNELYYIYKKKYNKEINSLNTDDKESFDYKNLRNWTARWDSKSLLKWFLILMNLSNKRDKV